MAIKDNLQPFWGFNVQGITKDDGSANDAFISSLQSELDKTELDLYSSKLETYLETAEGRWLDYWGCWLGLHRDNLSDDDYRTALINHVLHERNTISAIKEALTDFLKVNQDNVYIYEPWRDMFIWNASHYNTHKFFTDPYYRYAVIDIQIEGGYSEVVNEIVNLFRPAGVYWVVTSLVNVLNANAPILDLSLPTNNIIESSDTDYANFTQTNSAYLTSKLDLATYVGDPFNYNKDNLNAGKQYATSNSSYNPVVFVGSNKEDSGSTIKAISGGVNLVINTSTDIVVSPADNNANFATILLTEQPKLGDVLTISAECTLTGTGTLDECQVMLYASDYGEPRSQPQFLKAGQRDSVTLKLDNLNSSANTAVLIYAGKYGETAGKKNVIHHLMVEKGAIAHKWLPNPSDSDYDNCFQTKYQEKLATTINTTNGGVNLVKDSEAEFSGKAYDFHYYRLASLPALTPGKTYTMSFIAAVDDKAVNCNQSLFVHIYNPSYSWGATASVPVSTSYQRGVSTFTVPEGITDALYTTAFLDHPTINGKFDSSSDKSDDVGTGYIKYFMLEEGTVAHAWSPNPSDSGYTSWLQTKQQNELAITSQQLKQQLGNQITDQPALISSMDSQSESFTVDQTQTSLLGGIDILNYLTVYKQAVKPSNQTAKQFILANLATSNTQRLELVLQNQANLDLTQDVSLELYDYNLHLWIKPVIDYEVHSDYTIFKISLPSLAPYLSDGGNFMFQVWPTTPNITTLSVNYLGFLFNAPSDIITLANSDETFTMETN